MKKIIYILYFILGIFIIPFRTCFKKNIKHVLKNGIIVIREHKDTGYLHVQAMSLTPLMLLEEGKKDLSFKNNRYNYNIFLISNLKVKEDLEMRIKVNLYVVLFYYYLFYYYDKFKDRVFRGKKTL